MQPAASATDKMQVSVMIADHLQGIEKFADNLRANSNLASNEYFMPIMGWRSIRRPTS
jgi:type I restriction enzyme M protein